MRAIAGTLALLASIGFVPTAAFAQAVIAGAVKDASGAVFPSRRQRRGRRQTFSGLTASSRDSSGKIMNDQR